MMVTGAKFPAKRPPPDFTPTTFKERLPMTTQRIRLIKCHVCSKPIASDANPCTECGTKDPFGWVAEKENLERIKSKALLTSVQITGSLFFIFFLIKFWEPLLNNFSH
jgi:hypothetical protein